MRSPPVFQGLAVTADERRVAYVAQRPRQIYVRSMSQFDAVCVVTADSRGGINNITFSPDGQSLAYWGGDAILRVPASGGSPVTVCQVGPATPNGLTWSGDVLLYAHGQTIFRVAAHGGEPEKLVRSPSSRAQPSPRRWKRSGTW
jgi:hypothetical protein